MGIYQTLVDLLTEAPSMSGVAITFGEETNYELNVALPRITIYPTLGEIAGGVGMTPTGVVNTATNMIWDLNETIQIHCWTKSKKPLATILDHYGACEDLRQAVLQAFRYQRYHFQPDVGPGIYFNIKPSKCFWVIDDGRVKPGRAFIIELSMRIAIPDEQPVDAIIKGLDVTQNLQ
jgi:hypothetical protein